MRRNNRRFGWAAAALVSLAVAVPGAALAQSMTITPTKGQTPQQVEQVASVGDTSAHADERPVASPEQTLRNLLNEHLMKRPYVFHFWQSV